MNHNASLVLATTALALLSACGGGGGNDNSSATVSPLAITATNQTDVSRAAVAGGLAVSFAQTADASDRSTAMSATLSAPASLGVSAIDAPVRRAVGALFDQRRHAASVTAQAAGSSSSVSNCGVSGTLTSTLTDRDNSGTVSAGDSATLTFLQCRDSSTEAINGTVVVSVTSGSQASFAGSVAYQQVVVTSSASTLTINGSTALTETNTDTASTDTITVGSSGLTVAIVAPSSYNDTITYASGMTIVTSELTSPVVETQITLNGSFSSTFLHGSVALATITPVTLLPTDLYPSAGQVRITGANGSVLLLTAAPNSQLRLQLDAQGDQVFEGSTLVSWSTLLQ